MASREGKASKPTEFGKLAQVQEKGVKWVAVPNRATRSAERKQMEKSRWFK
jgi:hypothetical protein